MSSFTKVPTAKALYIASIWLQDGQHSSKKSHSFRSVKSLTHHPCLKYKEKQRNADVLLHNHVFKKVFRAWTKLTRKARLFRRRREHRVLSQVIDAWHASSRVDAALRRKAKSIVDKSHLQTEVRVFRALKLHACARKRDQRLLKTIKGQNVRFTLRTMFNSWFSQFASIDKKR